MSDLSNQIKQKEEILELLRQAWTLSNVQNKMIILRRVYTESGISSLIDTGISYRYDGIRKEIEELKKLEKES